MDILTIYAISVGSIFALLFVLRIKSSLNPWTGLYASFISRHFTYPYLLGRHRLAGPWTRAGAFFHLVYIALNAFLTFFHTTSVSDAGHRAGELSMINMIFLISALHLSYLSDLLGITLRVGRRIHRAAGWAMAALLLFHVSAAIVTRKSSFSLRRPNDIYTVIGATCFAVLILLSCAFFRHLSYGIFLCSHQALAGVGVYGIWRHLPPDARFSWTCLYTALGILAVTSVLQFLTVLHHNGLFAGRGGPRLIASCETSSVGKVRLAIPRPLEVYAGQYINLWMPSLSWWSWMRTHPFVVISYSPEKQGSLDMLLEPQNAVCEDILRRAQARKLDTVSLPALFTGPHGVTEPVGCYETVLIVASGFGITAVIPYMKKIIHGYNTSTSQARRLHLVWQAKSLDIVSAGESLLNDLLQDDILDDGYILSVSIYVTHEKLRQHQTPFGEHKRATLYEGCPSYRDLIAQEASGEQIERLPNIEDKRGKMLVMVSTSNALRDQLQHIVRDFIYQDVTMTTLDLQSE